MRVRYALLAIAFLFLFSLFSCAQQEGKHKGKHSGAKLGVALAQRIYYSHAGDSLDVMLVQKDRTFLANMDSVYRVLYTYHNIQAIRIPVKNIARMLRHANTVFADAVKTPREELTTGYLDLATNKLNLAHARYPNIDGRGILASIKEQQLDTADIDYAARYVNTNSAAATFTTHASIMATTLAGAGNSSPFAKGAAPGAFVTSTSFFSLLPESDAWYRQWAISVQNHSYGTAPENYYGAEAAAYDQSAAANPTLVHVFSAGNAGASAGTGPYSNLQGWANLTGNYKTAKNVLVVGAIDSVYRVSPAISKGPTFDGRVKPEVVAFGEDGSSAAAALTSGTVALLQQAYNDQKKKLPTSALVKAILVNSADAIAQKPLSFSWGYGSLNGYNAVRTVREQRFMEDSVQHGDLKKFQITVPARATRLKVTLAWTDAPAAVNATKALVNNLDAVLINQSTGERWLPWMLNSAANNDSLLKDAVRTQDTINNIEQITISAPAAGDYEVQVNGRSIATATQAFAIAYAIDTAGYFEWTFPTANDPLIAAQTNIIRWQTTDTGKGRIDFTADGNTWQQITDTANLQNGFFKWAAPDTFTTAQLRMHFSSNKPSVSDTFVISKTVTVQVGFNCADSFLLFWNKLPPAHFRIYHLEQGYLAPLSRTTDTAAIFNKAQHPSLYYSVAPVISGREGLRSYTVNYTAAGADCYFRSFYAQFQNESEATFSLLIGTYYNIVDISFQKLQNGQFTSLQTTQNPDAVSFLFTDTLLTQGVNTYRVAIRLRTGAVIYSNTVSIYHFRNTPVIVYPNPAQQHHPVTIITSKAGRIKINVYDAAGQVVQQQQLTELVNRTTLSYLSKGIYFIETIEDDGTRHTQKLVVF